MATLTVDHPTLGKISYRDNKRYWWALAILLPAFPLLGVGLYLYSGLEWTLMAPLVGIYLVVPLLDWALGSDTNNPPEELVPQLEEDRYYRYLTYATVPMHFIVLFIAAYVAGSYPLSSLGIMLIAMSVGLYSGLAINTAHELGHKQTPFEQLLARICLAVPAYGHFSIEHNRGHHVWVSTPEDPASARMGESIYAFALREIPGTFVRGWQLEKQRLAKQGKSLWSPSNQILHSYALSAAIHIGLIALFGWVMVPFLLVHNAWAWFQLTSANYVEHYGLLRSKLPNGRYERCQPHHSWNANYIVSNLLLFHLERHSDHHANPSRRYQSLRNFEDLPELPNGYYGVYWLAYIPWLWYRVMDKKLLRLPHMRGDLSKINIQPSKRAAITARYASN